MTEFEPRLDECVSKHNFFSLDVTVVADCNGVNSDNKTVNRNTKTLNTLNFPEDYDAGKTCTWALRVPTKKRLRLDTFNYIIEDDVSCAGSCCYDYLKIYNGWSAEPENEITSLCGKGTQEAITSNGTDILIKFKSDKEITKSGFQIQYEIINI